MKKSPPHIESCIPIAPASVEQSTYEHKSMDHKLDWFYGPTKTDPDPGKMWHRGCGGEVWYLSDGLICSKCHQQESRQDSASESQT